MYIYYDWGKPATLASQWCNELVKLRFTVDTLPFSVKLTILLIRFMLITVLVIVHVIDKLTARLLLAIFGIVMVYQAFMAW